MLQFLSDPLVQRGFNSVPTEVAFVELDRLVVYQKRIDLAFVRRLLERLGPTPTAEEIFRFCLPYDHPSPPVTWERIGRDTFIFISPSNDLRFLRTLRLEPRHLRGQGTAGTLVGVVGAAVGFGSNFLNAIRSGDRLILNNGSHRAYALRALGYSHAPCVVQHAATRDELEVIADTVVEEAAAYYVDGPRPPMLKDYFNPAVHKVVPVRRQVKQVTVKFEVSVAYVPDT